jgi:hypothetical protein
MKNKYDQMDDDIVMMGLTIVFVLGWVLAIGVYLAVKWFGG